MGISPGWVWLFLPVCQALVVPREVSSRVGETLSIHCWYPPGYKSYNKYWCRGASRDSCRKVVETEGREVPWQYGRFSIKDNRVFCVVLLIVKNVFEVDAGSYWCGIERTGRDLMEPVTVKVVPAAPTTPEAPQNTTTPWISTTVMEHPTTNNNATTTTNATTTGSIPGGPPLSILVPVVVLLSLLAVAGSAGLLYTLHRRREAPSKMDHGSIYDNALDLAEGGCGDLEQDPALGDPGVYANTLCLEEGMWTPGRYFPGEKVAYMS